MRRNFLGSVLLSVAAVLACSPPQPRNASAVASLPEYTAADATFFGDTLGPAVFELPAERPPGEDPQFQTRVERADFIVAVRVATLTEERLGEGREYALTLSALEPPLRGTAASSFEVQIQRDSPARLRIAAFGQTFVGRRFLLFGKQFADNGKPTLHWYGEADAPSVRRAVERAALSPLDAPRNPAHTPK